MNCHIKSRITSIYAGNLDAQRLADFCSATVYITDSRDSVPESLLLDHRFSASAKSPISSWSSAVGSYRGERVVGIVLPRFLWRNNMAKVRTEQVPIGDLTFCFRSRKVYDSVRLYMLIVRVCSKSMKNG